MREKIIALFKGETTISKMDLWLIGGICFLAGIVIGIMKAPWSHGIRIGCNNGNHSSFGQDNDDECCCDDECWCEEE